MRRLRRSPEVRSSFDKAEELVADAGKTVANAEDTVTRPGPTTTRKPADAPSPRRPAKATPARAQGAGQAHQHELSAAGPGPAPAAAATPPAGRPPRGSPPASRARRDPRRGRAQLAAACPSRGDPASTPAVAVVMRPDRLGPPGGPRNSGPNAEPVHDVSASGYAGEVFGLNNALLSLLSLAIVVVQGWALVDCVMRPAKAFEAAGKLTKPAWLAITADRAGRRPAASARSASSAWPGSSPRSSTWSTSAPRSARSRAAATAGSSPGGQPASRTG